jgi:hypothetical protein
MMPAPSPRRRLVLVLVLASALGVVAASDAARSSAAEPLRVRSSEAFAPCLKPALEEWSRQTGRAVALEVRDPDPADGADVVIGDDSELTRVLEGGSADLRTAIDLGSVPWVFVVPSGSPAEVKAAVAGADRLLVLGGRLGREARAALGPRLPAGRVQSSRDVDELRAARYALVPRSLAGAGEQREAAGLRPLLAVAAAVSTAADPAGARQLLAFLASPAARALLAPSLSPLASSGPQATTSGVYAAAVVDWWLPQCSQDGNWYNDPQQALGSPNALSLGQKDRYLGFMSLGQGGYVVVDMGASAIDGTGPDVRVFQSVSGEPVTLYAAGSPQGPFTLVGLRVPCGERTGGGVFSNHCDFDLHDAHLAEARYFKVEDGELYPCLKAGTHSEGADIDAVQILNQKP